jgi:hypothetical protein
MYVIALFVCVVSVSEACANAMLDDIHVAR